MRRTKLIFFLLFLQILYLVAERSDECQHWFKKLMDSKSWEAEHGVAAFLGPRRTLSSGDAAGDRIALILEELEDANKSSSKTGTPVRKQSNPPPIPRSRGNSSASAAGVEGPNVDAEERIAHLAEQLLEYQKMVACYFSIFFILISLSARFDHC